MQQQVQPPIYS